MVVLFISIYVRKAPKSLWFSYMALAICTFTVGSYFSISSVTFESAMVANKIHYLGVCYIGPFMLLFMFEYCGKTIRKPLIALIMVIPTITLVLVQTWPMHTLYYKEVTYITDARVPYLLTKGAPFYYVFFIYTYCLAIISAVEAFRFYRRSSVSVKKQSLTLIIGITCPLVGNILNVFKISPWKIDLTSVVMSLTCILLSYSIIRQGLYRIIPIAREQIVESMDNGFILVDMQGRFLDANVAAIKLLPQLQKTTQGTKLDELEELAWLGKLSAQGEFSVADPVSEEIQYHRISKNIISFQQQEICNCYMIFDITDTKQLLHKVSDLAERDPLTGIFHRGTFYEKGWQLLQNSGTACLLMMDLDFFKNVNDQYGHLKGDEVLRATAETLSKCVRSTDLLARYGGEEFCALLPSLGMEGALDLAERIRTRVAQLSFESEKDSFHVTVSIGVASYLSAKHQSFEDLVADADAAMYEAKAAGRNIVVLAMPQ